MKNLICNKSKYFRDFFLKKNFNINNIFFILKKYSSLFNFISSINFSLKFFIKKNFNDFYYKSYLFDSFKNLINFGFNKKFKLINNLNNLIKKIILSNKDYLNFFFLLKRKKIFKVYILKNFYKFFYNFKNYKKKYKLNKNFKCFSLGKLNLNNYILKLNFFNLIYFFKKKNIKIFNFFFFNSMRLKFFLKNFNNNNVK